MSHVYLSVSTLPLISHSHADKVHQCKGLIPYALISYSALPSSIVLHIICCLVMDTWCLELVQTLQFSGLGVLHGSKQRFNRRPNF